MRKLLVTLLALAAMTAPPVVANGIHTSCFEEPRPTRMTVVVKRLVGERHLEITSPAVEVSAGVRHV